MHMIAQTAPKAVITATEPAAQNIHSGVALLICSIVSPAWFPLWDTVMFDVRGKQAVRRESLNAYQKGPVARSNNDEAAN